MKRIAILYICTGKYSVLWKEFYESFESLFLPHCQKDYYVFTDAKIIEFEKDNCRIHRIYQEALPWPYPTLLRFRMFLSIKNELSVYDYIFFFNSNAQALKTITEEMVLPRKKYNEKLVVVKHPSFNWSILDNPYDRNPRCRAYIPYGFGKVYVQACILGGKNSSFLKMAKKIAHSIDCDLKKGVIALWHDESYVQRYILFRKNYRLLGREFARQNLLTNKENIIYMRPKEKYFDVDQIKENAPATQLSVFANKWNHFTRLLAEKKLYKKQKHQD